MLIFEQITLTNVCDFSISSYITFEAEAVVKNVVLLSSIVHTHTDKKPRSCDLCGAGWMEARESYGTLTTVSVVNGPVLTVAVKPQ